MKVLMLAWAANAEQGSEPGIGWAFAKAAAVSCEVHLVVGRPIDVEAAEGHLAAAGNQNITIHIAERPDWTTRLGQSGHFQTSVFLAQFFAARQVKRLVAAHDIDLVHHVTFTSDWMPSAAMLTRLDVPVVWGPIGGAGSTPLRYWKWFGRRGALMETRRALVGTTMRAITRILARRTSTVLANNLEVQAAFRRHDPKLASYIALDRDEMLRLREHRRREQPVRAKRERRIALFGGRLLPYKGLRLAIEAMAAAEVHDWDLRVVGAGPQLKEARELVRRLGLDERVSFVPAVARPEFLVELAECDALLMPSFHEAGGWVYAEAAAIGTPIVCLDFCGPHTIVDPALGHRLVPLAGDLSAQVSHALAHVPPEALPDDRWWPDRLEELLDVVYDLTPRGRPLQQAQHR